MEDLIPYIPVVALIFISANFLFTKIAKKLNIVDIPNNRKKHTGKIALSGGTIVFFSLVLSLYLLKINILEKYYFFFMLFIFLGILDDLLDINALIKLVVQSLILIFAIYFLDFYISFIGDSGGYKIELGKLSYIFTFFCLLTIINAFNFIDGLDGICTTSVILSVSNIIILSLYLNLYIQKEILQIFLILIFLLFLFLLANFKIIFKNKIFLGDSGSLFLGLFLGIILILSSEQDIENFQINLPTGLIPWIIAMPIMDMLRLIIIRVYDNKSPFAADNNHFHHIMKVKLKSDYKVNLLLVILNYYFVFLGLTIYKNFGGMISGVSFFIVFLLHFIIFEIVKNKIINNF
tara:strand:- start:172 stop:1218 length:1047 start_codon:yes stop_codon:yes gene_type:complete